MADVRVGLHFQGQIGDSIDNFVLCAMSQIHPPDPQLIRHPFIHVESCVNCLDAM